jgi:hypothetical protein
MVALQLTKCRPMENFYDHETDEWMTTGSRYERILAEPRFEPIRESEILGWPADRAWALILELLAAVPEDLIAYVGAGPLESFVVRHAPVFVDEIEAELRRNARLRTAVIEVNLERGELPSEVERRIVAAFGPRFSLLERNSG